MSTEAAIASPQAAASGAAAPGVRRRAIFAWCLYDWANSPYITLVTTFVFSTYFTQAIAPTKELGASYWGWAMVVAAIAIAILSPPLGAIADKGGRRKPWLAALSLVIAACATALWWAKPGPDSIALVLIAAALSVIAFEISMAFYNAMLPQLVQPAFLGRISGWGWALGYIGGLAALLISLLLFVQVERPPFGLDKGAYEHVRIAGPLVAVWLLVFALPLFLWVPDRPATAVPAREAVTKGLRELATTIHEVRKYPEIVRFLAARLLFMEGINTVFLFGGIFAATAFGMNTENVIIFGILINVTAAVGAFGFAWMDERIGSKETILLGVAAIAVLCVPLLLVRSTTWFWILGVSLGLFFGPVQAAARTMMARMAPENKQTEMFGLLALSGKAIAFLGPLIVGATTALTNDLRWGMATLLPFMVVGGVILLTVKAPRPQHR